MYRGFTQICRTIIVCICFRKPQYNMAIELPLNLFHCSYDILEDCELHNSENSDNMELDNTNILKNQNQWIVDEENLDCIIKSFQVQWTREAIK